MLQLKKKTKDLQRAIEIALIEEANKNVKRKEELIQVWISNLKQQKPKLEKKS